MSTRILSQAANFPVQKRGQVERDRTPIGSRWPYRQAQEEARAER